MRFRVEPCRERLAALWRNRQDVVGCAIVGNLGRGRHVSTAEIRPPPQIGAAVAFVHRQRTLLAAFLRGDSSGWVAFPRDRAIESVAPRYGPDLVLVDPPALL